MASPPFNHPHRDSFRTYRCAEVIIVHKTKDAFGGLSNMAGGYLINVHGTRILTSEALYQACRFPHLPEVQKEIIGQHSPMTAKMKSKPYRSMSREDWNLIRFKVMRWCLRVKLAQNYYSFGDLLMRTENKSIVEQSRKDDYWGAKLTADGEELVGENILGRLLMELREKLKQDTDELLKTVPPLAVPDFNLFGKPIDTINSHDTAYSYSGFSPKLI